jgi:hypothetical protein
MTDTLLRTLSPAPDQPVRDGQIAWGCYGSPFKRVNMLDAQIGGLPLRLARWWQLREWQAFQIANQHYFVMMALYNAKRFGLVQFILLDRTTNEILRYEKQVSPLRITLPDTLYDGYAAYKSRDFQLSVHSQLAEGKITIDVMIQNHHKLPPLAGQFVGLHDLATVKPCVVCLPFDERKGMYAHKCLMPINGQINMSGKVIYFSAHHSGMFIDDHKGYYPSPTQYDWATAIGYDRQDNFVGFNLTRNQVPDQNVYNENALWLNHALYPLPPVSFRRDNDKWYITDQANNGSIDLIFSPTVHTNIEKKVLFVESRYNAPYGYFDGYIDYGQQQQRLDISRLFGMGEDFYLKV